MKSNLTIKDSSMAFISGFLFSYFFSALMLVFLSIFLHVNIENFDLQAFSNTAVGYLFLSVSLQVGILLVFIHFKRTRENKVTENFSWKKLGTYSLVAIVGFFLVSPMISCLEKLMIKINLTPKGLGYEMTAKNYLISLISMVIFPAVCEELLFRGIILKGMKQHGKNLSVVLSALAFSIFHMSIFQTVYPLIFGLLLGIIMYRENNIIYTITMHFINNFLSLTFVFLGVDFFINHWLFFILVIVLFAVFLFALIKFIKSTKEINKTKLNKPEIISIAAVFAIMLILWLIFNIYGK